MLTQSLSLSFLFAAPGALVVATITGDLGRAVQVAGLIAAAALALGGVFQLTIAAAYRKGRVDRALYRPLPPVIDSGPAPLPEIPTLKQVDSVRLVPVYSPGRSFAASASPLEGQRSTLFDGVDVRDLRAFIEGLPARGGHQRRRWLGVLMPSGRKVDNDLYELLVGPLVKCGAIAGRGPRRAGELTCSPQTIKELLNLAP